MKLKNNAKYGFVDKVSYKNICDILCSVISFVFPSFILRISWFLFPIKGMSMLLLLCMDLYDNSSKYGIENYVQFFHFADALCH